MNVFWGYRVVLGALLCLGWLSILAQPAYALVEGTTPKTLKTYRVFGGAVGVGNTLMSASPPGNVNDILLPQSSARVTGLPFDAKLTDAYVWWTGSIDGTVDRTVDFTLANGQKVTVTASAADCQSVQSQGGFF